MADRGRELTDGMLADLEERIKAEYRQASKEVQRKLNDYLTSVAEQTEAQKALLKAGKITEKEFKDWEVRKLAMGKRWEELRDNLAQDYVNADKIARNMVNESKPDVYALNHNYMTYKIEHDAKVDTSYTLYDRNTVKRLMKDDPDILPEPGKRVSQLIAEGKAERWNKQKIQSVMMQSILQGENINQIAGRLARAVGDSDAKAAIRNARTMTTNAENAGRYDGMRRAKKMGIDCLAEWQATLDERTRTEHRYLHGQRQEIDTPFEVSGVQIMYPADLGGKEYKVPQSMIWNCRCSIICQIKGFEVATVKYSPKMGDMTFEEWQKAKPVYGQKGREKSFENTRNAKPVQKPTMEARKTTKKETKKAEEQKVYISKTMADSIGNRLAEYENLIKANSNIQTAYATYSDSVTKCILEDGGGQYKSYLKQITWDYDYRSEDVHPFGIIAHEFGHHVDYTMDSSLYKSTEVDLLNQKLGGKYYNLIDKKASTSDEFLTAMRTDRQVNMEYVTNKATRKIIRDDLRSSDASACVQDAFDGFWGTQDSKDSTFRLNWGHGDRYYNREYNRRIKDLGLEKKLKEAYTELGFDASSQAKVKKITRDYETASELWANITSAKTVGGKELEYMEKYFPNTVKTWDEIIGRVK